MKDLHLKRPLSLSDRLLLADSLVHTHIVHEHRLRKNRGGVRISRPASSHRDVEYKKKRMIEYPLPAGRNIRRSARDIKFVIDIEANCIRLPLDCKNMEVIGEPAVCRQSISRLDSIGPAVAGPVDRSVRDRRLLPNVFHDVDLATTGPLGFFDVI